MLDIIAHSKKYGTLSSNIGNAFLAVPYLEKLYSKYHREFGELEDCIVITEKSLYEPKKTAQSFRLFLVDFIRIFSSRCDRDSWMRECAEKDGYNYVFIHVGNLKDVAKDPERWTKNIVEQFQLKVDNPTPTCFSESNNHDKFNFYGSQLGRDGEC